MKNRYGIRKPSAESDTRDLQFSDMVVGTPPCQNRMHDEGNNPLCQDTLEDNASARKACYQVLLFSAVSIDNTTPPPATVASATHSYTYINAQVSYCHPIVAAHIV
jgi:hypothetical protein